jgi:hypothetical protein
VGGVEVLAQAIRPRDLREELEALVALRGAERLAEARFACGRVAVFPEGFDVHVVVRGGGHDGTIEE